MTRPAPPWQVFPLVVAFVAVLTGFVIADWLLSGKW